MLHPKPHGTLSAQLDETNPGGSNPPMCRLWMIEFLYPGEPQNPGIRPSLGTRKHFGREQPVECAQPWTRLRRYKGIF